MFVLKFIIFLVILFALIFNGLLLASNPSLSGGEKSIGIALYAIIIIVVLNFYISYTTYFHTKDKIGPPGDPGIEGQKGDKGKKAICKPNCGRKICYVNVKTFAENVLNNEIQKIRGTVQISYDFIPDTVNTKKRIARTIREKLQNKYEPSDIPRDDFGAFSKDYVTVTKSGESTKVRISGSKSMGDKLYKEFLSSDRDTRTRFLNLEVNGTVHTPNLIIEDIRALSNCLNESEEDKDNRADVNDPANTLVIEVCGEETTSATATTQSGTTSGEEEEIKKFMSGMDKRYKIRNDYMVKKINKICNSNEYLEALERKHRNKINEMQLIEYIKDILEEIIIYLIQFRVRKTDGLSEGEESKVIYAGLNFLLTKTATENYFDLYKQKTDEGKIVQIKSPILELKKYDIYRWGEKYINSPLLIEKCSADFRLPAGKEQELNLVSSNNYLQVYNSKVKDDIFYSGFKQSCQTYCPYNQMGREGKNLENRKECIYYNINDRGHRNLRGTHPSWVEKQFMKPPPLGLYHPNNSVDTVNADGEPTKGYFQDDRKIYYYPVGSVWTARIEKERKNRNDFSPISNNKASGHSGEGPEKETILLSGNLLPPVDYKKIWNSTEGLPVGIENKCQVHESITIWEPIPPKGYVCMGHIVSQFSTKDELFSPDNRTVMCVPESCVIKIPIGRKIWDSEKLIIKEMGEKYFTSADRYVLHLNCFLREKNERSKQEIMINFNNFVNRERSRLNSLKKDTINEFCRVDVEFLMRELQSMSEKPYINNWDGNNIHKVYTYVNQVAEEATAIEEKYSRRYEKVKNMVMKDIRNLKDKITPKVTATNPVYIFSAGATGAFEEGMNIPGIKIDNDGGHNLFMACTSLKKAPKFAYKLNRSCLYARKIKPINLNTVPGVLNFNQTDRITLGKSAEQYFTYPKDLIIESINSDYSPTGKAKRYYLSFSNKPVNIDKGQYPLYFIRAANMKTKDFSLCKMATFAGDIVDSEMDTMNKRCLFVIETQEGPLLEFTEESMSKPIRLLNSGIESETPQYFEQRYSDSGKNEEVLTSFSDDKFILKRI